MDTSAIIIAIIILIGAVVLILVMNLVGIPAVVNWIAFIIVAAIGIYVLVVGITSPQGQPKYFWSHQPTTTTTTVKQVGTTH